MRWPRDLRLWQDWFNAAQFRLFGTKAVGSKRAELNQFEPTLLQKDLNRPLHWIKRLTCTVEKSNLIHSVFSLPLFAYLAYRLSVILFVTLS